MNRDELRKLAEECLPEAATQNIGGFFCVRRPSNAALLAKAYLEADDELQKAWKFDAAKHTEIERLKAALQKRTAERDELVAVLSDVEKWCAELTRAESPYGDERAMQVVRTSAFAMGKGITPALSKFRREP